MNLGIIGPDTLVNKINRVVKAEFPNITPVNCIYQVYTEAPTIIKYQQPHLDALLFAGSIPFALAKKTIRPIIPWEYIPRNGSSFFRVLLEAALMKEHETLTVSFDSNNKQAFYEAYEEIGINKEKFQFYFVEQNIDEPDFLNHIYNSHANNYFRNNVTCCITSLQSVFERLSVNSIPCLLVKPTIDIIREIIKKLILGYQLQINQQNQIVALYIQIDDSSQYSVVNEDEYQYSINKIAVSRQIYLFAKKIEAAVIEVGLKEYLLFSTRQILESETQGFEKISLLTAVKNHSSSTISLGVGFGRTAQDAKQNARIAMTKASKKGGDMAFILSDGKTIGGPVKDANAADDTPSPKVDEKYLRISDQIGVSINTINRLHSIIAQSGQNTFTAIELANLFGVTLRTMNKVIEKLENGGYCSIIGKKAVAVAGRPRRIIQIDFSK